LGTGANGADYGIDRKEKPMSDEENRRIARRFIEICNQQQFGLMDELFVEDYVHHDPNLPPELQQGRENYKQVIVTLIRAFPDLQGTIDDQVSEGDRVVTRLRWHGTHQGELMGIPPSGKAVDFGMIEIQRITGDKIVEGWVQFDALSMLQQVGAIPVPA
jgi:steroid delta-isomerase-like uncharacterized protein